MEEPLSARMPLYKFFTSGTNIWLGCMITRKPGDQRESIATLAVVGKYNKQLVHMAVLPKPTLYT